VLSKCIHQPFEFRQRVRKCPRRCTDRPATDRGPPSRRLREYRVIVTRIEARNSAGYEAPMGLAADPVVFTVDGEALSVLLVRRTESPARGKHALPGGFVGPHEDPAETVVRKLEEKAGIPPIY